MVGTGRTGIGHRRLTGWELTRQDAAVAVGYCGEHGAGCIQPGNERDPDHPPVVSE